MYEYAKHFLGMDTEDKWRRGPTMWVHTSRSLDHPPNVPSFTLICPPCLTRYLISSHLEAEDYARMYRASDCYVIPTRGEGWGMPITEAMAMVGWCSGESKVPRPILMRFCSC